MEPKNPTREQVAAWLTAPPGRCPVECGDALEAVGVIAKALVDNARELDGFEPERLSDKRAAEYKRLWPRLAKIATEAERKADGMAGRDAFLVGVGLGAQVGRIVGGFLVLWAKRSAHSKRIRAKRGLAKAEVMEKARAILHGLPPGEWPSTWQELRDTLRRGGLFVLEEVEHGAPRLLKTAKRPEPRLVAMRIGPGGAWVFRGTAKTPAAKAIGSWLSRERNRLPK